jgi:hypothetical protein
VQLLKGSIINSVAQSPSLEVNNFLATQDIQHPLQREKSYHSILKGMLIDVGPVAKVSNPVVFVPFLCDHNITLSYYSNQFIGVIINQKTYTTSGETRDPKLN